MFRLIVGARESDGTQSFSVRNPYDGREGLKYAIEEMTETKMVCFNFWRP